MNALQSGVSFQLANVEQNGSQESQESQGAILSHEDEIAMILDEYLRSLDRAVPVRPEDLLIQYPQHADQLRVYLSGLELLQESAAGFAGEVCIDGKDGLAPSSAQMLGEFELIEEIGRGGMGVVFRAKQQSLDRHVAVKVLPFAAVVDGKQLARFKTEARTAALVHHPNIVPVHAIGHDQGVHYYAMHLVEGSSLAEIQVGVHDLSIDAIVRLGIEAAGALHAAHEHGIVHRDIKPSNLLLDSTDKLWITDFGLARIQSDLSLTQTRDVIGTMHYMSPEQSRGNNLGVDHRTDIYSLGATLYELLTGRRVVEADDAAEALRRMDADPIRPRVWNTSIPRDLESVVLKCLARSKEARYETAADLADDLQRFAGGIPTLAKPAGVLVKASKWMRRHQRLVALLTTFLAVLAAVLSVSTVLILRESGKKEVALRRARSSTVAAQQNYRDARTAVDHFGSQIAEQLIDVPGAESIRNSILTDTLAYYERFVERTGSDASSRLDTAITLTKIADLRQRSGQTEEAIRAYRRADELLGSRLVASSTTGLQSQQISCKNNLALLLSGSGRIAEAQSLYDELLSPAYADLARPDTMHPIHNNAGLLAEKQGDYAKAKRYFESAVKLQQDSSEWRERATTLNNLGMLAMRQSQMQEAIAYVTDAIQLYERNNHLDHAKYETYRHEHAITETNLASIHSTSGGLRRALEHYLIAANMLRELARDFADPVAVRSDLASTENNRGLIHDQLGQIREATRSFQNAINVQMTVTNSLPNDANHASALASMFGNQAVALNAAKQPRDARAALIQAIKFQEQAITLAPNDARYTDRLTQFQEAMEAIDE